MLSFIEQRAGEYITELLSARLPKELCFHDKAHTQDVVKAVTLIGEQSGLAEENIKLLQIAAWFHDSGYTVSYHDHEAESIVIAENFLQRLNCPQQYIVQICALIAATRMPQNPQSLPECVICDADLFHLAKPDYKSYEQKLRDEWAFYLHKTLSDKDWKLFNIDFLIEHRYFTTYGQTVLQELKLKNIKI